MAQNNTVKVITPPNALKAKLGGSLPKIDAAAIARAERALQSLSGQFEEWMKDELTKLESAWTDVGAQGLAGDAGETLYRASHDLKGLGTTYEYPLVTRLAGSLCRLIETDKLRTLAPKPLVAALVNGIRIAIRDQIKDADHPAGLALAQESEAIVAQFLKSAAA